MDIMKKDLIFVIGFGFYMKKQAERKTHLGTPKASYRALVCREILVGVAVAARNTNNMGSKSELYTGIYADLKTPFLSLCLPTTGSHTLP